MPSLTIVRHLVGLLSCKTFFQGSFLNWDNFASIYVQPLRKGNGWVEGVSTLACIKIAPWGHNVRARARVSMDVEHVFVKHLLHEACTTNAGWTEKSRPGANLQLAIEHEADLR